MARYSEVTARLGRQARTQSKSNTERGENASFPISIMNFNIGETKRIVIPKWKFSDGSTGVLILGEPTHKLKSVGFLQKVSKAGKHYSLYEVRCMNPKRQVGENRLKYAEDHTHCVYCELARLESRKRNKLIREEFDKGELKDAPKDEQRAFYQSLDALEKINSSYLTKKQTSNALQYVVGLEIETEEVEKEFNGNIRKSVTPVLDENGLPKYKLVYIKCTDKMLTELKTEAENAFYSDILGPEYDYTYESEGTDENGNPEQVKYTFVDFQFVYPHESSKGQSAMNRSIRATSEKQSMITKEFVDAVMARSEEVVKLAEENLYKASSTLTPFANIEEQISLMEDGGKYYRDMVKEFGVTDENRAEPEQLEDGTYSVQLTDEEWEEIGFRTITEGKPSSELEIEVKKKVLADKGIEGEPYIRKQGNFKNSDETADKKEEPKQTAKKATKKAVKKVDKAEEPTEESSFFDD